MATAKRVPELPKDDTRDVVLTLTNDEAKFIRTIVYCKVAGTGPLRSHSRAIDNALRTAGVTYISNHYDTLVGGSLQCADVEVR